MLIFLLHYFVYFGFYICTLGAGCTNAYILTWVGTMLRNLRYVYVVHNTLNTQFWICMCGIFFGDVVGGWLPIHFECEFGKVGVSFGYAFQLI